MAEPIINTAKLEAGLSLGQAFATEPGRYIRKSFDGLIAERMLKIFQATTTDAEALALRSEVLGMLACLEAAGDLVRYANGISSKLASMRMRDQAKDGAPSTDINPF